MASIEIKNAIVEFPVYGVSSRSLKKQFLRVSTGGKLGNEDNGIVTVRALNDVSLNIEHGDRVGLIGHNGAGKSTFLRLVSKIYEPVSGTINIEGKISSLLDVMLGMDQESTGYENIVLRGILDGLTKKEILAKKDEIVEFTGLGDYLSLPVRTYSSGMQLRLAFGIATSILPEILVLDEVVGTGDANFLAKAQKRFDDMIATSHIVILASHSVEIIRKVCNKVLLLDAGKVKFYGDVDEGLRVYCG